MKRVAPLLLGIILCAGCASTPKYTWWGDYSTSLYQLKREPTDENREMHKKTLLAIIEGAGAHNNKVPPGVCCEYGFMLMKEGKSEEALRYFNQEEREWPESGPFIQRLKTQMEKRS